VASSAHRSEHILLRFISQNRDRECEAPAELFSDLRSDLVLMNVHWQPKEAPQERRSPVFA
jgi:hypothetical protein